MAGSRPRVAVVVFALLLLEVGAGAVVSTAGFSVSSPGTLLAVGGEEDLYPHVIGQEHIGGRCTPDDTVIAAGTIVGIGGQVVAGGGGTGIGCDTFYAYEFRSGEPNSRQPFVEPGLYMRRGGAARL